MHETNRLCKVDGKAPTTNKQDESASFTSAEELKALSESNAKTLRARVEQDLVLWLKNPSASGALQGVELGEDQRSRRSRLTGAALRLVTLHTRKTSQPVDAALIFYLAMLCANEHGAATVSLERLARVLNRNRSALTDALGRIKRANIGIKVEHRVGETNKFTVRVLAADQYLHAINLIDLFDPDRAPEASTDVTCPDQPTLRRIREGEKSVEGCGEFNRGVRPSRQGGKENSSTTYINTNLKNNINRTDNASRLDHDDLWFDGEHLQVDHNTHKRWLEQNPCFRARPDILLAKAQACDTQANRSNLKQRKLTPLSWFEQNWLQHAITDARKAIADEARVARQDDVPLYVIDDADQLTPEMDAWVD